MDPDSYQKAWHAQSSQTRVTIAADLLLKEVQRSQRNFRATIFRRDFREVVIGLLMLPLWFYWGHTVALPWTWCLGVPAITWVILFILVDRIRHKQRPSEPGEPLLDCVKSFIDPGGASNLAAAKRVLVVPAAVYDRDPGVLRADCLVESLWILADHSCPRALRAVFACALWIRVLPEPTRRTARP